MPDTVNQMQQLVNFVVLYLFLHNLLKYYKTEHFHVINCIVIIKCHKLEAKDLLN